MRNETWGRRISPENEATRALLDSLHWVKLLPPPAGYVGPWANGEATVRFPGVPEFRVYRLNDGTLLIDESDFASFRLAAGDADA